MTLPSAPAGGAPLSYQLVRLHADQLIMGDNARKSRGTPEKAKALFRARSVRQAVPLAARTNRVLLDGYRTLWGWELSGRPDVVFDVILTDEDLTPDQIAELQGESAFHREDWNLADKCEWIIERLKTKSGQVLATELAVDPAMISNWRAYEKLSPEGKQAVRDEVLLLRPMVEVAKAAPEHQPALLAKVREGATAAGLIKLRKELEVGGSGDPEPPPERTAKIKITLAVRSKDAAVTGTVTVAGPPGKEIDLSDSEELLNEALKAVKAAKATRLSAKSAMSGWKDIAEAVLKAERPAAK